MVHLEGIPAGEQAGHFQHDQVQETDVGTRQKYVTRTDIISVCILAIFFGYSCPIPTPQLSLKNCPAGPFTTFKVKKAFAPRFRTTQFADRVVTVHL